ncbi:MAG: hypothetical protein ABIG03_04500 [Candidatus Eisenbacteria bacterium]
MRTATLGLAASLCVVLVAGVASANPVVLWYVHDSPVGAGNGVWDDQWSGGTILPPGEIVRPEDPGYDPDCGSVEAANVFAPIGSGPDVLRAYLDPPFTGTQPDGAVYALFSFRQTCAEMAFVTIELYKVDVNGNSPEFLVADYAEITAPQWPPVQHYFALGNIPEIEMQNERFMVVISSDGQCTDVVWDCTALDGWIQLPEDDPFNPVARMEWSAIKALYR